ncbi:GLPGLI family protein [uncultured Chryseobacterium sp.]|uniref:GLPGLI family protein n=1 Tax=uncultured Chryseobacterium sp. TaxID=259322 RepID=UPI0025CE5034|nr:GLPGLI family protein [uncultured Chryseobacterium sp.]
MKKNKIFRRLLFFSILNCLTSIYAQNKVFKYDLEYKPNPLQDSIVLEKTILDVKDHVSIFRSEKEKKSDSLIALTGLGLGRKMRFEDQFYTQKNLSVNEVFKSIQTVFSEFFFIRINDKLNWEILPEKNKMANFEVQKAKVTYGGRNWTAWFTAEIPIQDGPYVFYGLPGLIVKISDDQNDYNFSLTEVKNGSGTMYYRNKGSELTWEQFQTLVINHYSDPFARINSMGVPIKKDDGAGNVISLDLREESERLRKIIRENNNPVELNHKVEYK